MAIDPIGAVGAPSPVASVSTAPPQPPGTLDFAATLQQQLAQPRATVQQVREQIAALRNGGVLRQLVASPSSTTVAGGAGVDATQMATMLSRQATGDAADPYGWRSQSRQISDQIIGQGYGPLFERQIQQESGFAPDVVYGLRTSTAGAEGIAQLMPQYYPGVQRTNPQQGLVAGAQTMHQYLTAWNGDVRKALASYNAGLGRVRSLVAAHGAAWESGLPAETRQYINAIVGTAQPVFRPATSTPAAVFGGRGPGGVLIPPLDTVTGRTLAGGLLALGGLPGDAVRAPADGVVSSVSGSAFEGANGAQQVTLDHGNGWRTTLDGLASVLVAPGSTVRRSDVLGTLAAGAAEGAGLLQLGVQAHGEPRDPSAYLLGG